MIYHGMVTESEMKARCKSPKYKAYFKGTRRSRRNANETVKMYELIEDDSLPPVKVTQKNIIAFHKFFTQHRVV